MRFPSAVLRLVPVLLSLGPVLLSMGPCIQANRVWKQCQNSAKYRPALRYTGWPFHGRGELHQKDLRINLEYVQIRGPVQDPVYRGGHVSGLKSNRAVLRVPRVKLAPTC